MATSKQAKQLYKFGPFSLDAAERLLLRDGQPVPLTPKAFDLLLALVENRGHLLGKDELMRRLWPGAFVEEANLPNTISLLRKALGEEAGGRRYIETVPRRGYRFIAKVVERSDGVPELVVEERTRNTLTLEQEPQGDLEQAVIFPARSTARRLTIWFVAALVILAGAAWVAYYFLHKPEAISAPIRSIAVLPFKPLVAESRDESLEMGMADTLITRLSSIRQIVVRPTSAVRKYIELGQDAIAAGREQGVDAVLDGSIQKSGERIRVRVRLVSVRAVQQLWADQFDEKVTDIFAVQDSISQRVAAALAVKLSGDEKELVTKHGTDSAEAYQLYLMGRHLWKQRTAESLQKSIEYFNQAIQIDPNYALAYAAQADSYLQLVSMRVLPPKETIEQAKMAAAQALAIDEKLGEAHTTLASISANYYWDWPEAERHFKQALELNPNYAPAHQWYGEYLGRMGRLGEALTELRRALELDPLSPPINSELGGGLYEARQYDQAIWQLQRAIDLYPRYDHAHIFLGLAYEQKGRYEEAIAEFQKVEKPPLTEHAYALTGHTYALWGKRVKAEKVLTGLHERSKQRYVPPFDIAIIYTALGDKDRAFEWLDRAYLERDWLITLLKVEPKVDSLRSDPRFADLLRRVGLEQ